MDAETAGRLALTCCVVIAVLATIANTALLFFHLGRLSAAKGEADHDSEVFHVGESPYNRLDENDDENERDWPWHGRILGIDGE